MEIRKRILFVDDEPRLLDGLRRMLFRYRDVWDMEFAPGGAEALELLSSAPYDVIVADMRMPGINGAQLLNEVTRLYPHMVRMILSGTWEQDLRMQAAMVAHQYLTKPCDPEQLKATLDRAFALREVLVAPELRALIARTSSLPSTPAVYRELMQALQSPDASMRQIAATLARDVGMTAKILQLVNSAFFGLRRHISNLEEAATALGLDAVRALTLSASAFSSFDSSRCRRFSIDGLQRHSTAVATKARAIAVARKMSRAEVEDTFVAGLLHDVGRLLLVAHHPSEYDRVLNGLPGGRSLSELERDVFGTTHEETGGYLLWLWGLPDTIVEAVAFHHRPSASRNPSFGPAGAVHVANALAQAAPDGGESCGNQLDAAWLACLGAPAELPAWAEMIGERAAEPAR